MNKVLEPVHGYAIVDEMIGKTKRLCEWPETAERLASRPYECVCPRELWYDPEEGRYYGPIDVESPHRIDKEAREHNERKVALQQRLRDAGFDPDEIRKTLMI